MSTIVHFEIPADDVERAKKFYGELFGWKIEKFTGQSPMEYWTIETGAGKAEMALGGGMMKRQMPDQQITIYIDVPSIEEYSNKVKRLGGSVVVTKTAIPDMGYFAICLDPEHNGFGLWEDDPKAR